MQGLRWRKYVKALLLFGAAFAAGLYADDPVRSVGGFLRAVTIYPAAAQEPNRARTYQMLALFGDVFERIREEYVDPVSDEKLIGSAISGMLNGLDPHSSYLSASELRELQDESRGVFAGVGIEVMSDDGVLRVVEAMRGTPAFRAGIKIGDIITELNGHSIRGVALDTVMDQMRGPPKSKLTLTIERKGVGHAVVVPLHRQVIRIPVVEQRLEPGKIGYVRLAEFTEQAEVKLRGSVKSLTRQAGGRLRALVLDLRGNPGGLLDQAIAVARDFVPRGVIVSTLARHSEDARWFAAAGTDITKGAPVVALIDGDTASAAEIVAGALQDHRRAVLVGTRTFGKGSVQTVIPLPGGTAIRITTDRYYTPSGRSIQALGIAPDVPVQETREAIATFGSEQEADLNRALRSEARGPERGSESRSDLPSIAKLIPTEPPVGFRGYDEAKPEQSDFQLQQALVIAKAMASLWNRARLE